MSELAVRPPEEAEAAAATTTAPAWDASSEHTERPWWEIPSPVSEPTPAPAPAPGGQPSLQANPEVEADRARARTELAGKFEVVPDGYDGPRNPNTLTESEYAQMAATYSDIRRGKTDIVLNTQAFHGTGGDDLDGEKAALDATMNDFATMMQTEEGRAVIGRLANNTAGQDADGNPVHHTTTLQIAADRNATPAAAVPNTDLGDADPAARDGHGTDSIIVGYHPGQTLEPPPGTEDTWAHQERSDVALFHELVHSVRQTAGSFKADRVGNEKLPYEGRGKDFALDEYITVGLNGYATGVDGVAVSENLYRQARNNIRTGKVEGDGELEDRWRYYPE